MRLGEYPGMKIPVRYELIALVGWAMRFTTNNQRHKFPKVGLGFMTGRKITLQLQL